MLKQVIRRAAAVLAAALAAPALTGCARGPLTAEFQVIGATQSLIYRLEPDGRLTVGGVGGGAIGESSAGSLHESRLDPAAMEKLKGVVFDSGFFLAEPPYSAPMAPAVTMVVEISLGLWHNRLDTRGASVQSVDRIITEINRYLPERYALPPTAGGVARDEREIQQYLEEMRKP